MSNARRSSEKLVNVLKDITKYISDNQGPGLDKISGVLTHIFISSIDVISLNSMNENSIKAILFLGERPNSLIKTLEKRGVPYKHIAMKDQVRNKKVSDPDEFYDNMMIAYQFIHEMIISEQKTLICCKTGNDLSVLAVVYYLLNRFYLINSMDMENPVLINRLMDSDEYAVYKIIEMIMESRPCGNPGQEFLFYILICEVGLKENYKQALFSYIKENETFQKWYQKDVSGNEPSPWDDESPENLLKSYMNWLSNLTETETKIKVVPRKKYDRLEDLTND